MIMRDSTAEGWYVTMNGEKHGPFGRDVLKAIAKSGNLNPRIDRVWHAGMEDWVLAGDVEDLFEKQDPEKAAKKAAKEEKKAAGSTPVYAQEDDYQTNYEYQWPGVGRAGYIFGPLFFSLLIGGLIAASQIFAEKLPAVASEKAPFALAAVWVLMLLLIVLQRFTNLGMSKWWFLGLLVPGLDVWVKYRLFACPPGYGPNRKMDGIGWVLASLYWLTIIGVTVGSLLMIKSLGPQFQSDWQDPAKREQIIQSLAGDRDKATGLIDQFKAMAEKATQKGEAKK